MSPFLFRKKKSQVIKKHVEMDGISIEVLHKPIKNMHLRIYPPDGKVRISAPLTCSVQSIRYLLETKREWIHAQRARLQAHPALKTPQIQTGELHNFLGKPYLLALYSNENKSYIKMNKNRLQLWLKPNLTTAEKEQVLQRWYRHQMNALLPDLIQKWQPIIGVEVNGWVVKIMKSRWGSCNPRTRRISLNLTLIKKPLACLEYVLVHEMIHILEASHNKRFYRLMDTFMPEWRMHRESLST